MKLKVQFDGQPLETVKRNCQENWHATQGSIHHNMLKFITDYHTIPTRKEIVCLPCFPRTIVNAAAEVSSWGIDTKSETTHRHYLFAVLLYDCANAGSHNFRSRKTFGKNSTDSVAQIIVVQFVEPCNHVTIRTPWNTKCTFWALTKQCAVTTKNGTLSGVRCQR